MALTNLVVTLSNLYGILPIYHAPGYYRLWMGGLVTASVLMHLSETKHGLPGIYPFNIYSNSFLLLDRLMAYTPIIYLGYQLLTRENPQPIYDLILSPVAIVGAISVLMSEGLHLGKPFFAITHSIWHICAYHLCYQFLTELL